MHRIVGLRLFQTPSGDWKQKETFQNRNWAFTTIADMLRNHQELLQKIPENERYNLFYSMSHVQQGTTRVFERCDVIAFDIDKIPNHDNEKSKVVANIVCQCLGISFHKSGVVHSGNGTHVLIPLSEEKEILTKEQFLDLRPHYRVACLKINKALLEKKIGGIADPSIFEAARILRLPGTWNKKPDTDRGEKWPNCNKITKCILIKQIGENYGK